MKKRIIASILIMSMLAACGAEENSRGSYEVTAEETTPSPTQGEKDNGQTDGPSDKPGPEIIEKPAEDEEKDIFYDECNGERTLMSVDLIDVPGDLERALDMYTDWIWTERFDYRSIEDQEKKLVDFIDREIAIGQLEGAKIDRQGYRYADRPDPRGVYEEYGFYMEIDKKALDECYQKLYNCTDDDLGSINGTWNDNETFGFEDINTVDLRYDPDSASTYEFTYRRIPYSEGGKYYFYDVDSWAEEAQAQGRPAYLGPMRVIKDISYDGYYYYVNYTEYEMWDYYDNDESLEGIEGTDHSAVLKWVEDEEYWSLYFMDAGHMP